MSSVSPAGTTVGNLSIPSSWPVWAAIAAYPLWWALGLDSIIYPLLGVVLVVYLVRMRPLRLPPGWLLWVMFLLVVIVSGVMLDVHAPGTAAQGGIGPYGAYALRLLTYISLTMLALYVGNHSEQTLPIRSVVAAFASLGISVGLLGLAGVLFPDFSFRSPASFVLPEMLIGNGEVRLAQVQDILGEAAPRPSAPFEYTNTWGEVLSMLLVWVVLYAVISRKRRMWLLLAAAVSLVPILASLNRGVWIGIVLSVVYVAIRLAMRLRLAPVAGILAVSLIGGAALALTPAGELVTQRVETGHSDQIRENLANDAIRLANESPLLGYGSTRRTQGSYESIAVGPSADCTQCGERIIGSTGHLWLLLVAQGWLGTVLYFLFFGWSIWTYRRDHSPVAIAATGVVLLSMFYAYFYSGVGVPLAIALISVSLLWRGRQARLMQPAEEVTTR